MTTRSCQQHRLSRPDLGLALCLTATLCLGSVSQAANSDAITLPPAGRASNAAGTPDATPAGAPQRVGHMMEISLPVTSQTLSRVQRFVRQTTKDAQSKGLRPVLIFRLQTVPGQAEFGRGSQFGAAYELADFLSGQELNGATTVAYIPSTIEGHAVLVAIACDEIIMAPDAQLGPAGVDEQRIDATLRSAYKEIADRRKTVPAEIALAMLDPAREVLDVQTELSREFVSPEGLKDLEKRRTIKSKSVLIRAGEPGRFSGTEARRLGLANYLANNPREVAQALNLPATAVVEDPSLGGAWLAVQVAVKGPISAEKVDQYQRLINEAIHQRDVNFVSLWIQSPGGSLADSVRLATFLAEQRASKIRTVAYIPQEARSDAALIAMACDQVVMHPQAELGGSGAADISRDEVKYATEAIRKEIAPRKNRTWSLTAAMIDPNLAVFRSTTKQGDVEFFCDEELASQPEPHKWTKGEQVTTPGFPFRASGLGAVEYQLADRTVDNYAQFKQFYGLTNDLALMEPGWADFLIEALASPGVAVLLLMIGGAGLYIEFQAPGIGIGGFIAAICFLLFFWSRYLGGTAGWLEAVLFLAGLSFLLLEIFILPGFGIFGLGGGLLILASIVLASQTFWFPHNEYQFAQFQQSLLMLAFAAGGITVAVVLMNRYLPRAPVLNRVMLLPPSDDEAAKISRRESLADFHGLVGQHGVTTTQCTPSGKARFGDRLVDVIAEGEIIETGAQIVVVEVHGYRVIVQTVEREV